jgi:hypothetical protein
MERGTGTIQWLLRLNEGIPTYDDVELVTQSGIYIYDRDVKNRNAVNRLKKYL